MIGTYLMLTDDSDDKKAFENLYYTNYKRMYGIAKSILNDTQLAEDAVSDTFFYIARNYSRLKYLSSDELKAYCYVAVKNFSKNIIRRNSREVASEYTEIHGDSFLNNGMLKDIERIYLKEKIAELSFDDRELLTLYYFYRFSLKEISDLKKLSYNTVKKYLINARAHLKLLLDGENNDK